MKMIDNFLKREDIPRNLHDQPEREAALAQEYDKEFYSASDISEASQLRPQDNRITVDEKEKEPDT